MTMGHRIPSAFPPGVTIKEHPLLPPGQLVAFTTKLDPLTGMPMLDSVVVIANIGTDKSR